MSAVIVLLAAVALSVVLILILMPLLQRYALSRPNARSSHKLPTPQGGGIAVVASALACAGAGIVLTGAQADMPEFMLMAVAAVGLAVLGAVDDIHPLPASLRLVFQALAVAVALAGAGEAGVLFPFLPTMAEWFLIVIAGIWFVNLANFMDGLDWMTVAEMAPIAAALLFFATFGWLDPTSGLIAAALLGALLGFAPFNRPIARLFLGDVGSLPIGLIVGFLLYKLACEGGFAAALLLPLYYLADATITLMRRLARREKVWVAHRSHFYQRATDNGWPVLAIVGQVAGLNILLAILAALTLVMNSLFWQIVALGIGALLVGLMLYLFSVRR